MDGCQDAGCWDVECGDVEMQSSWGVGVEGCWGAAYQDTRMQGDGDNVRTPTHWEVRIRGCRDTAAGQCDAVRARPGPCTYSAARSTPGKRVMAKGAVLWDGSSPRLSSHSSFPTTGASLNPWPAGRRRWLGGVRPPPWSQPALGCWGGGRAGCPRLPEKPAPMMMLLNLGCLSRMKSSSGVFWGSHGVRVGGPGSSPGPKVEGGKHGKVHLGVEEGLGPPNAWVLLLGGGVSPCRGRSPPRPAGAPARAGSC